MSQSAVKTKWILRKSAVALCLCLALFTGGTVLAAEALPLTEGSKAAGISFDDKPLSLPVQRNFQMAMMIAASELGRSCGDMEAYGWRVEVTEQQRVNKIFNSAVDRLRAQGFTVQAKSPGSVSQDITLFTADRDDKHLMFMWSAGDIGLALVLCETTKPQGNSVEAGLGMAQMMQQDKLKAQETQRQRARARADFTPEGDWVGSYSCAGGGYTGGTLRISKLDGKRVEGLFRFYPTERNPSIPSGRYVVTGEYDPETLRVLINPGKWLERPVNYQNTIIIGRFDPDIQTFSGIFQGIEGCTSFEARRSEDSLIDKKVTKAKAKKKVVTKKKSVKTKAKAKAKVKAKTIEKRALVKEATPAVEAAPASSAAMPNTIVPESPGISLNGKAPAASALPKQPETSALPKPPEGNELPAAPSMAVPVPPTGR